MAPLSGSAARFGPVLLTLAGSAASLKFLPAPYVWIAALWGVLCFYAFVTAGRSRLRFLWYNAGFVFLALGGTEAFFWVRQRAAAAERREGEYVLGTYHVAHPVLGYAPVPGKASRSILYHGDELVYDVVYTIDSSGLRASPPYDADRATECVLFFGGSFVFGEGVRDDETLPYRTGVKTDGRYRIYNFGFHGYGPHQMLAALQSGMVDDVIDCRPKVAVYRSIADHVARAAGLTTWDRRGPRFVLDEQGRLQRAGRFDDRPPVEPPGRFDWAKRHLDGSALFRWVWARLHPEVRSFDRADVALFLEIVSAARAIFEERYPGSEFHVLYGVEATKPLSLVVDGLRARGVRVHLVDEILPGGGDGEYRIPYDRHHNARAHDLLADYVVTHILGDSVNPPPPR